MSLTRQPQNATTWQKIIALKTFGRQSAAVHGTNTITNAVVFGGIIKQSCRIRTYGCKIACKNCGAAICLNLRCAKVKRVVWQYIRLCETANIIRGIFSRYDRRPSVMCNHMDLNKLEESARFPREQ